MGLLSVNNSVTNITHLGTTNWSCVLPKKIDQMHSCQQSCFAAINYEFSSTSSSGLWKGADENDAAFISFRLHWDPLVSSWINSVLSLFLANTNWQRLLAFCSLPVPLATDKTPKMISSLTTAFNAGGTAWEVSVGRTLAYLKHSSLLLA